MISELASTDRYVLVSGRDRYSSVYDLELDKQVLINNEVNVAKNIKLSDNVSFLHYDPYNKKNFQINFEVKYVGYSRFPSSCFTGDCVIQTILGSILVNTLRVGDIIISPQGKLFPIKCILKTNINHSIDMMIHPDGLVITGFHPVKIDDKWCFPSNSDLFEKQNIFVDSVYSIGLEGDDGISLVVNGIEVAGLGHNVTDDEVLSHPYFGSNLVISDIFKLAPNGYCVIEQEQIIRDDKTKFVCGIVYK